MARLENLLTTQWQWLTRKHVTRKLMCVTRTRSRGHSCQARRTFRRITGLVEGGGPYVGAIDQGRHR